jgi:hypothetical protein
VSPNTDSAVSEGHGLGGGERRISDRASLFYEFRLDDRVPKDHLLRRIDVFRDDGSWGWARATGAILKRDRPAPKSVSFLPNVQAIFRNATASIPDQPAHRAREAAAGEARDVDDGDRTDTTSTSE